MSKQRVDYKPTIKYTSDYQTYGKTVNEQNLIIGPQHNKYPLDTQTIPNIESNLSYLDSVFVFLPYELSRALKEVYDPIRDVFYDTLIDKIVDPNPQVPEIIIKPNPDPSPNPKPDPGPSPGPNPDPGPGPNPGPDPGPNPGPNPGPEPGPEPGPNPGPEPGPSPGPGPNPNPDPGTDPNPEPGPGGETEYVYPIILRPIDFNKPNDPDDDNKKEETDKEIHPIILKPMKDSADNDGNIQAPHPIILRPLPSNRPSPKPDINEPKPVDPILKPDPYPVDPDPEDGQEIENEEGLWEPPSKKVEYTYPDLNDAINREFVYLLSRVIKHYTDRLKDIINNYLYNFMRYNLDQNEENINFISNRVELTSNDILNHSKHLLDSSVKNENVAALRTEFFKNVFSIKDTAVHLRSFMVSHELRKRYTNINYSKGKSVANSMSDAVLQKLNAQYELQYRKNFENLFRYLESSLKVTEDILRLYVQDGLNKSTIIKKGGIK